jgi:hypothetical protein
MMHTAACQNFRPAYLHSTNTVTVSSSATDRVTVKHSPPFQARGQFRAGRLGSAVLECPPRLAAGPAGTGNAFRARIRAIPGQCTARAHLPGMTAGQPVSDSVITSLQMRTACSFPGSGQGSTTAPVPSAPGNPRVPWRATLTYSRGRVARPHFLLYWQPPFPRRSGRLPGPELWSPARTAGLRGVLPSDAGREPDNPVRAVAWRHPRVAGGAYRWTPHLDRARTGSHNGLPSCPVRVRIILPASTQSSGSWSLLPCPSR